MQRGLRLQALPEGIDERRHGFGGKAASVYGREKGKPEVGMDGTVEFRVAGQTVRLDGRGTGADAADEATVVFDSKFVEGPWDVVAVADIVQYTLPGLLMGARGP